MVENMVCGRVPKWLHSGDVGTHDRPPVTTVKSKSTDLGGISILACATKWGEQTWRSERGHRILYLSDHRIERAFAPSSWTAYDEQDEGIRGCDLALL